VYFNFFLITLNQVSECVHSHILPNKLVIDNCILHGCFEWFLSWLNVYESHGKDQGHISQISVYLVSQIRPVPW